MALMAQQAAHDLLEAPLPVAEPHLAGGRHRGELLVGQVGDHAEGAPSGLESLEQAVEIDTHCTVGIGTVPVTARRGRGLAAVAGCGGRRDRIRRPGVWSSLRRNTAIRR